MTEEQERLLIMRGMVRELPEVDRVKIQVCAQGIRDLVGIDPKHGALALSMVFLENVVNHQ
jgi:hypothetical protein